jgi:DNA replication protein DnaD
MEDGQLLRKILAPHWWDMSPLEAKIFITLYWFADPTTGELSLSIFSLSQKINTKTKEVLSCLERMKLRGLVDFTLGKNPLLVSQFKILRAKITSAESVEEKNSGEIEYLPVEPEENLSTVNVNGKRSERFFKKNVPTGNVTGTAGGNRIKEEGKTISGKLTAESLAKELNDQENLALYEAYLKRYPHEIILKAYQEVLQTPPEKIKRSAGAYFNLLVKKLGSQNL